MVPAILVKCGGSSLLILVIAQHDIQSACEYLARDVYRIGTVYHQFLMDNVSSTAAHHLSGIVVISDDGSTFCGSIAHRVAETDVVEQFLYLSVERSTTDDYFIEVASQCFSQFVAYTLLDTLSDDGHLHEHLYSYILNLGQNGLSYHLFYDERNHDENAGLNVCQCTHEHRG